MLCRSSLHSLLSCPKIAKTCPNKLRNHGRTYMKVTNFSSSDRNLLTSLPASNYLFSYRNVAQKLQSYNQIQVRFKRWSNPITPIEVDEESPIAKGKLPPLRDDDIVELFSEIVVIDQKGNKLGCMDSSEALKLADEAGCYLELVKKEEVPICRFFERNAVPKQKPKMSKEERVAKKNNPNEIKEKMKEIQFSDKITEHDLQTKIAKAMEHLLNRHKVKIALIFKRRHEFDPIMAKELLENIASRLEDVSIRESEMKVAEERQGFVVLRPASVSQLVAKGFIEKPQPKDKEVIIDLDAGKTRKQIRAERDRERNAKHQEMLAAGLVPQKPMSPQQQALLGQTQKPENDALEAEEPEDELVEALLEEEEEV